MHCHTAWRQWAVEPLQCAGLVTGSPAQEAVAAYRAELLQCSATLLASRGQCNSCNALPHRLGATGSATPATQCLTAWGRWAVQVVKCTATPPRGSGQCNSCNALPNRLGTVGSATLVVRGPTNWGDGEFYSGGGRCLKSELLHCAVTLCGCIGQWSSCNALPHCPGAAGIGTLAMRGSTSWGDGESCPGGGHCLKSEPLQCTATLTGGQWVVGLLQCVD